MHYRWQAISHYWRRTVVLLSVALLIAWNFATIAHQLDLVPEHHSHHHCQMFAGSHHGLVKAQPELLTPTYQRSTYSDVIKKRLNVSDVRYTARAPPIFA
ncbi:DUF2607 family protein [Vibrio campbellii]|uniref:DUF2607 family protein n=1 Tax=Vibrio campbellii TaxID=680 RepID=UPI0009BD54B2|nr:DUF2607 family protein [Vibrio campbellii]MCR9908034.1 DUF2607 domain-containing protein [Vibrio campbellii]OQQ01926.1 hypothetical protein BK412_16315 [Vibrio campbellii]